MFYCCFETHVSFVTTDNGNLDIEKMKLKWDVCIFGLSIGLTLNKRNSLNNLKSTIYNHLKKKNNIIKASWKRICFSCLMSNQCLDFRLFTYVIIVQLLLPAQPLVKFWKQSSLLMGLLLSLSFSVHLLNGW